MNSSPALLSPVDGRGRPYGTAHDAERDLGIDLSPHAFVEEEYFLSGTAGTWESAEPGSPERGRSALAYRTRVLVRRPARAVLASGTTHVEPLHPHLDAGLSWNALAPHFLRRGDAWVGVTVFPQVAGLMRERIDPARYGSLIVPGGGTEWDVFSDALTAIRRGDIPGLVASRVVISGWSATGSFCRVFAREGFATARGGLADAVAIFISSGGAGSAGYPALSSTSTPIATDDPRRTIRDVGLPTFEILSETESETHRRQLRDDSDDPGDTYRLYQIAGSAHIEDWPSAAPTHEPALRASGVDLPPIAVREKRTDARTDLVARALVDRLVETLDGRTPPRGPRFAYAEGDVPERRMLRRDPDGNVAGGIRPPWITAPLAAYSPHGTPAEAASAGPDWTPLADRDLAAGLVGTMTAFPSSEVERRYASEQDYRARFTAATRDLVTAGFLLAEDAAELDSSAASRWADATGCEPGDA